MLLNAAQDPHKPCRERAQSALTDLELSGTLLADMLQDGASPEGKDLTPISGSHLLTFQMYFGSSFPKHSENFASRLLLTTVPCVPNLTCLHLHKLQDLVSSCSFITTALMVPCLNAAG